MATALELKQQQQAKQAQQKNLIRGVTGTVTQLGTEYSLRSALQQGGAAGASSTMISSAGIASTLINLVGAFGIGAWQFVTQKKIAKKKERLDRKQAAAIASIDDLLAEINEVGQIIIQEHGIDPTTPEFEQVLYDNLYKTIGYRGNCNINALVPGTTGDHRPVWFRVTQNGRVFEPVNMEAVPPNISTYWHTNCKNLKDGWANSYQTILIQEGRVQELEAFQKTRQKGITILRIVFGIAFAILIFFVIRYGFKIK